MPDEITDLGGNAAKELKRLCERIERLIEERRGINDDIKDVRAEAKANGYDVRTLNLMIKERAMDRHAREEAMALAETYRIALGLA